MTITIANIISDIKRHLSIIGKRLYSKDGKNIFSQITVSSIEDPIFNQYINAGAQNIEALLRQMVTAFSINGTSITISLQNTRGNSDFDSRCEELTKTYITLFSVGKYLAMTHPELAEKYYRDANASAQSLFSYAFYKKEPTANADPSNPHVSVA